MIREQEKELVQNCKEYITELPIFAEPGILFCFLHEDVAVLLDVEKSQLRGLLFQTGFPHYCYVEEDRKYKIDFDHISTQFGYKNHYVVTLENIGALRDLLKGDSDKVQKVDAMETALNEYISERI